MRDTTFTLAIVGLVIWLALAVCWQGYRTYKWLKNKKAIDDIDKGVIPADYDVVMNEQKRINSEAGGMESPHREDAVSYVREMTAQVRYDGYLRGERDQMTGMLTFEQGLGANPHQKGTGAAKQWVRGYCSARNVMDIKQYYDAA